MWINSIKFKIEFEISFFYLENIKPWRFLLLNCHAVNHINRGGRVTKTATVNVIYRGGWPSIT